MTRSAQPANIEIARQATLHPIAEVAKEKLGIPEHQLELYGRYKAKIPLSCLQSMKQEKREKKGKLILVTAITPTTAGEGKTTTSIGLADALNKMGKNSIVTLREPSLGPCFGIKGGACGGGYAQVVPMEDINLHFTGDFHAITSAHNLLAAMVDNHLYWGHKPRLDGRRITWRRVMDMNDRSLRSLVIGLGGVTNGFPRESRFDITAASEVMAILCLATDLRDLQRRLGNMEVGSTADQALVHAKDLGAEGAMTTLLREAINPNLVQTLEHTPALIHGGPFGNIAHGCNSVVATQAALQLADYVVTEAGFGADLGAEKFFNIKCRKAGLSPACAVVVATIRALKLHGGADSKQLDHEDAEAVCRGVPNLLRHLENVRKFGVPTVVALNRFTTDTDAEMTQVQKACADLGVNVILADHWARGGEGAIALAEEVVRVIDTTPTTFQFLYPNRLSLAEKVRTIAREIYRADRVEIPGRLQDRFIELENAGYGHLPICVAKTQYSFSTDPSKKGAPSGFTVPIREIRLALGAEFIVVIMGDIMLMPGLPKIPAAQTIGVNDQGEIFGLF